MLVLPMPKPMSAGAIGALITLHREQPADGLLLVQSG